MNITRIKHGFEPVFDKNSKILILGSLPSVRSRENGFYYGHPQNRFWRVLASVYGVNIPTNTEEKKTFLLKNGIALWDVIAECDIKGSDDNSIKNVIPNDISVILKNSPVKKIYANGTKAFDLYNRFCLDKTGVEIIKLPSTSPANATYTEKKLTEHWKIISEYNK